MYKTYIIIYLYLIVYVSYMCPKYDSHLSYVSFQQDPAILIFFAWPFANLGAASPCQTDNSAREGKNQTLALHQSLMVASRKLLDKNDGFNWFLWFGWCVCVCMWGS